MRVVFNIVYYFSRILDYLFPRNYELLNVRLNYTTTASGTTQRVGFWKSEPVYPDQTEYSTDITCEFKKLHRILRRVPRDITEYAVVIKYSYNRKIFKKIFYNPAVSDTILMWPPRQSSGMVFNLPILKACLVNDGDDGDDGDDVSKRIKWYAGPLHDFHGTTVRVRDTVYSEKYKNLKIENVAGKTRVFNIEHGLLIHPLF